MRRIAGVWYLSCPQRVSRLIQYNSRLSFLVAARDGRGRQRDLHVRRE